MMAVRAAAALLTLAPPGRAVALARGRVMMAVTRATVAEVIMQLAVAVVLVR